MSIAAAIAAIVSLPAHAGAHEPRVAVVSPSPVAFTLKQSGSGATGEVTLVLRADGRIRPTPTPEPTPAPVPDRPDATGDPPLSIRLIGDRGPAIRLASRPGDEAISLTTPRSLPLNIDFGQIRRVPLTLAFLKAPAEPFEGTLVIATRDGSARPATVPVTASVPVPKRWAGARLEPSTIAVGVSRCHPRFFEWDCHPPDAETIEAKGLVAGAAIKKDTVIAEGRAAGSTGGHADLVLKADEDIPADGDHGRLRVEMNGITQGGSYELALPTEPGAEKAPSLTAKLTARDLFVWPLALLLCGTLVAWRMFLSRERKRPRLVLQHALKDAAARYRADVASAPDRLTRPYDLDGVFPSGDSWSPGGNPEPSAVKLYNEIENAGRKEALDGYAGKVAAIGAQADGWLPTCRKATALDDAVAKLTRPAAATLAIASRKLTDARTPPADAAEVAAYQQELDEQRDAVELWSTLDGLVTRAQQLYDLVDERDLDDPERARLEQFRPDALRAAYLQDVTGPDDLRQGRVVARVREHIRVLTALEAANPEKLKAASGRRGAQGAEALDEAALRAALLTADGVPEPRRRAEAAQRAAADLLADIVQRDRFDFVLSALIAILAFFPTVYSKETFGSEWDYLAAFAAGAAGQLVINWQLLPWFRSYRPPAAEAKAEAA